MPSEFKEDTQPQEDEEKKIPTLPVGQMIAKRFKVTQKLGEGGCGSVYKVEDVDDKNQQYAMKVEFAAAEAGNVLKMEVQVLTMMASKKHVPKCIASGKKEAYQYMIMTLLGESLDSIVKKHGPILNVSSQMRIGISVLFGIKQIHDIGYIHRDLKPANVALGCKGSPDERYFLVLDFGLARQYISEKQKQRVMRLPRGKALFRGTARYCSITMHERQEQGRVDDLWMLVYMLAELRAPLPWQEVDDKVMIGEMKKAISDAELFANSPIQMLEFVKTVRATQFYKRPDYEKLFKLMDEVMRNADYKWSDPYYWESDTKKRMIAPKKLFMKCVPGTSKEGDGGGGGADPNTPYFTADDFSSNPIGF